MPYNDCECVRLVRDLSGDDLYGSTHVSIKAGDLATIVNVFDGGEYEIEFKDEKSEHGWGILHASEADLAPYVKNSV